MIKAYLNDRDEFEIEDLAGPHFIINGEAFSLEITSLGDGAMIARSGRARFKISVLDADPENKTYVLKVNGRKHKVVLRDHHDLLLEKMGMSKALTSEISNIEAPMPGLIMEILCRVGDEVKKGDNVIVLEAMKMENVIKSPADGMIKEIHVNVGDSVEKNKILIQF
ncbi:MAG: acetyl-CoA carboxylase biotin carboxyl carrier protein subunit [Bacteroidetes bacterium]|nr:acetyl-CoA carboxylase biotin carboxyl carrier protein subunit [Bacteroidota bacterium]MCH8231046.1 acetyl-CoA carboxylase biotin carboxyl carrier protein subunit [Bacteroidota bacterium]